jgi:hypothetical protein
MEDRARGLEPPGIQGLPMYASRIRRRSAPIEECYQMRRVCNELCVGLGTMAGPGFADHQLRLRLNPEPARPRFGPVLPAVL